MDREVQENNWGRYSIGFASAQLNRLILSLPLRQILLFTLHCLDNIVFCAKYKASASRVDERNKYVGYRIFAV